MISYIEKMQPKTEKEIRSFAWVVFIFGGIAGGFILMIVEWLLPSLFHDHRATNIVLIGCGAAGAALFYWFAATRRFRG